VNDAKEKAHQLTLDRARLKAELDAARAEIDTRMHLQDEAAKRAQVAEMRNHDLSMRLATPPTPAAPNAVNGDETPSLPFSTSEPKRSVSRGAPDRPAAKENSKSKGKHAASTAGKTPF
jgi:hypothetical protein